jgi:hypothetical protein
MSGIAERERLVQSDFSSQKQTSSMHTIHYPSADSGHNMPNPQPATRNPQPATRNPQPATRSLTPLYAVWLVFLTLFCNLQVNSQSDCVPFIVAASTDLPATVRPFCDASGFNVSATLEYLECTSVDVFVIIKARPKLDNSRFSGFSSNPALYFSDIVYAGGTGVPILADTVLPSNDNSLLIAFRFRVSVPFANQSQSSAFNFPFSFAPNWYFGDVPWRIYVHATVPNANGTPVLPVWDDVTPVNAPVSTLLFDAPYFPIVGSANLSTHLANLTGFSQGDFAGRAHSLMLLPDVSGNPPVLTIDARLVIGFGSTGDRGNIFLSPGAQIKILQGDTLFADVVDMFTCEEVSKGILVETGGRLVMNRPRFNDAEIAIDAKRGSQIRCFAGTFTNNYRAIRLDNTGSGGVDIDVEFTSTNDFFGGDLKPGYPGMTSSVDWGYGLEVIRHPFVSLLSGTFGILNTGIRAVNSSLSLGDVKFGEIKIGENTSSPWHGHAVWAWGSGVELLFFKPNTTLGGASISECERYGVYANRMNVTLDRIVTQANSGYFVENCRMNTVEILNNQMDCRYTGIRGSKCLPLKAGSLIHNNVVSMLNTGNTSATGNGILLDDVAQVTGTGAMGWKITDNEVFLGNTRWGIRFWGGNESQMSNNDVTFATSSQYPHYLGFDLLNANNMTLNCNNVFGNSSASKKGYFIKNVGQSEYTCNDAFSTSTGMEFSAMCDATVLKGSSFSGGTGLFLNGDVALGTQGLDYFDNGNPVLVDDHGNKWSNSSAFHAATQQGVVEMSKFGIDPNENPQFKPSSNWGNWFSDELTPTIPTFSCAGFSCLSPGQVSTAPGKELERAIADGSVHSSGLPGVIPKMLENHLYARLQESPSWGSETVFQQFSQSKANTSTAAFWAIKQGINAFHNRSTNEQSLVEAKESDILALSAELAELDSTRDAGTTVDESLYAEMLAQLASKSDSLRDMLSDIRAKRQTDATQLLAQNAVTSVSDTWEYTERKVNELEIRMFLQGDTLYAAQLTTLDSIGSLCVHTNGEAVLRAQVLYNLFAEKEYVTTCVGEREEQSHSTLPATLKIRPNPTSGWISLPDAGGVLRSVQVFDLAGRHLLSVELSDNEIDLSELGAGAYFLRVTRSDTGVVESTKLIVSQ